MKKILLLLVLLLFPVMVFGAEKKTKAPEKLSLICDKTEKINVNEQVVCRVTTNVAFYFNKISFDIKAMDGIEIVDVRSNYGDRWKIEKDETGRISAVSTSIQSDLQEFGIILIKALKDGREDLSIENFVLENNLVEEGEEVKTLEVESITQTFKIVSSDNLLKTITIDEKEIDNFKKDVTKYIINIGDKEEITIGA